MIERRNDHIMEEKIHKQHHEYLATLIEKENQKMKFRKAIIEKTTVSLIWSFLAWGATSVFDYIRTHWK